MFSILKVAKIPKWLRKIRPKPLGFSVTIKILIAAIAIGNLELFVRKTYAGTVAKQSAQNVVLKYVIRNFHCSGERSFVVRVMKVNPTKTHSELPRQYKTRNANNSTYLPKNNLQNILKRRN